MRAQLNNYANFVLHFSLDLSNEREQAFLNLVIHDYIATLSQHQETFNNDHNVKYTAAYYIAHEVNSLSKIIMNSIEFQVYCMKTRTPNQTHLPITTMLQV
jgi:hypothetical protein